jgi:hypothetical protein
MFTEGPGRLCGEGRVGETVGVGVFVGLIVGLDVHDPEPPHDIVESIQSEYSLTLVKLGGKPVAEQSSR